MNSNLDSTAYSLTTTSSNGQGNPLLLMCLGFGLLGGLIFPLFASFFMTAEALKNSWFFIGCLVGGLTFGTAFYTIFISMLRKNLKKVEKVVDAVGSGDLSVRCPNNTNRMLNGIAQSVNKMTDCLHTSITQIAKSTDQVSAAVSNMATPSAASLSTSVSTQQTKNAAAAVTEMVETVKNVAGHADAAATAARDADKAAKSGSQLASQAMTGIQSLAGEVEKAGDVIQKLEQDSQSIGVILEVIQGIAEQTNLLALNAAIEAARAGEQGRGFAVVADEVRTLASRTQKSTEEIKHMIDKLQTGAGDAVKVMETARNKAHSGKESVEKAADSLSDIGNAVSTIDEMNTQIATAAREQQSMANEISENINNINTVSEKAQTSTGVDSGAGIQELVNQLASEVSKFKR